MIFIVCSNKIQNRNAKRRRQRRRTVKNNNMSNQQKSNFARAARFFCTFLCRCFARLQRETSRNFLVTRFMEEMSYVLSFNFFTTALFHFALVAASIPHFLIAATKFPCCSSTKKVSPLFLSLVLDLCRPFSR